MKKNRLPFVKYFLLAYAMLALGAGPQFQKYFNRQLFRAARVADDPGNYPRQSGVLCAK